ncbi:hypothetical protein ACQEU8_19145 [Streptomyces sp. CA-250714]|uniref:hypothetical protein n=1 Tax=Streptomyces sp. CA-250714 TaxID=3240060 RepID=UPI003D94F2E9
MGSAFVEDVEDFVKAVASVLPHLLQQLAWLDGNVHSGQEVRSAVDDAHHRHQRRRR